MVFLWIPNLIGYARLLFLFLSILTCLSHPLLTVLFYGLSQALDAFDGMAARHFNQSSNFGAVLDMITDRISDVIMLAILASLYPSLRWLFYGDIILDLSSHWYQMYATLVSGETHHKTAKTKWRLLEIYYGNKTVLFMLVAGN